jgi:putative oxidoreductase
MFSEWFGFHPMVVWVIILAEFIAPLALIVGLYSRLMAAVIICIMIGAVYFVHWHHGFFMNWYSVPERGEGFEYHILAMTSCTVIVILGAGKYSLDFVLSQRKMKL